MRRLIVLIAGLALSGCASVLRPPGPPIVHTILDPPVLEADFPDPFLLRSPTRFLAFGTASGGVHVQVAGGAGIGLEAARVLASTGAEITLAVRRPEAARAVAEDLRVATGNPEIVVRRLDLSDLRSVHAFVDDWVGPLHVLINNAGIMAVPELELTPQGSELQFGTNYLGHFALALGLHRFLAAANGARVVSVSSSGHFFSPVMFDDLAFHFVPYTPIGAYGQSKSATALLAVGITQKWAGDGILSNALNPGAIATGLQQHTGGLRTPVALRKTLEQGAATTVLLATSSLLDGVSGRYFEDCNQAEQVDKRPTDFTGGYAAYALDPANAERLWEVSTRLVEMPSVRETCQTDGL